ncbi:DUF1178 family protein [Paracoccus suum]|uniref:DUF1178 family protein n=1 Tax=Paracoccus suum TaxID=2259340 RepID=A0A344PJ55_9RHOB|nr:DUF1178 family protein [Paracoccus suum]AXC49410.1 DUF1178 family protein [Paracoccus suum]
MIRYALHCPDGHDFEGWFRSSDVFVQLRDSGQVTCPNCGGAKVDRALMAPAVAAEAAAAPAAPPEAASPEPANRIERALSELRAHVEANSDYVGMRFVQEARAMHEGRVDPRPIHGEARIEDARRMITEGLPVMPLPFRSKKRMN